MYITIDKNRLIMIRGKQTLWIEPWGKNSLRVRMTGEACMDTNDWALSQWLILCKTKSD